jgi:hypothetical protein
LFLYLHKNGWTSRVVGGSRHQYYSLLYNEVSFVRVMLLVSPVTDISPAKQCLKPIRYLITLLSVRINEQLLVGREAENSYFSYSYI